MPRKSELMYVIGALEYNQLSLPVHFLTTSRWNSCQENTNLEPITPYQNGMVSEVKGRCITLSQITWEHQVLYTGEDWALKQFQRQLYTHIPSFKRKLDDVAQSHYHHLCHWRLVPVSVCVQCINIMKLQHCLLLFSLRDFQCHRTSSALKGSCPCKALDQHGTQCYAGACSHKQLQTG